MDHGSTEFSTPNGQQSLGFEYPHRLAQRRLADRELDQEFVLLGENVFIGELAGENAPAQLVGDLFGEPAKADGGCCHASSLPDRSPLNPLRESVTSR